MRLLQVPADLLKKNPADIAQDLTLEESAAAM
jgi:hypothetical protein